MRYLKTDLGRASLQSRDPSLPPAVRQVLILCDGKRTEQDLAALLPADALRQALDTLVYKGLLTRDATPLPPGTGSATRPPVSAAPSRPMSPTVPGLPDAAPAPAAPSDPERFRQTVSLLTGFAAELGFTGRLKAQLAIERANTMAELLVVADELLAQLAERGKVTPTMRSQVQALRQGLTPQA